MILETKVFNFNFLCEKTDGFNTQQDYHAWNQITILD